MTISQLIKKLEALRSEIGDVSAQIKWQGCSGHYSCADDVQDIEDVGYGLDCSTNTKTLYLYSKW